MAECVPKKAGPAWQCARAEELGGKCAEGPRADGACGRPLEKCSPLRTHAAWHALAARWAAIFGVAVVVLLLAGNWRERFIVPGDLSFPHARILGEKTREACATCHSAAQGGAFAWFTGRPTRASDSQRCLACHELHVDRRDVWTRPHSMTEADLRAASLARGGTPSAGARIACGTCHKEHRGAENDMKVLSNEQCQTCHASNFRSFADGHPDFGDYPKGGAQPIVFSHRKHHDEHFAKARVAVTWECRLCHEPDPSATAMRVRPFEQACATCHKAMFDKPAGIVVAQFPGLQRKALEKAGAKLEGWPEDANGDVEEPISPVFELLLSAGPESSKALASGLPNPLSDLGKPTAEQAGAVEAIAREVRLAFVELSSKGPSAIGERIRRAALSAGVEPPDARTMVDLCGAIPAEVFAAGGERWLAGKEGKGDAGTAPGGFLRDADFTVRYRGAGHADPFARAWLDLLVRGIPKGLPGSQAVLRRESRLGDLMACLQCHVVGERDGAGFIDWKAELRDTTKRSLTRFQHRPHLVFPKLKDCEACHAMAAAVGGGDFLPVSRQTCLECHTPKGAGDACLKCHLYHRVEVRPVDPARK